MAIFEIELAGLDSVIGMIEEMGDRINDLRPLAATLGQVIQSDVDERFNTAPGVRESAEAYGGVTWDSLTEAYLKANPRREGGQQLRDTGELLNSFTVGGAGNVFESDATGITFGSALPKATGLHRKRPIVVVHEDLVEAIATTIQLWITEGEA